MNPLKIITIIIIYSISMNSFSNKYYAYQDDSDYSSGYESDHPINKRLKRKNSSNSLHLHESMSFSINPIAGRTLRELELMTNGQFDESLTDFITNNIKDNKCKDKWFKNGGRNKIEDDSEGLYAVFNRLKLKTFERFNKDIASSDLEERKHTNILAFARLFRNKISNVKSSIRCKRSSSSNRTRR